MLFPGLPVDSIVVSTAGADEFKTYVSGWTITKLPSAVIITPALPPSPAAGCSTVLRNDLGIPVVRLNRGLFSQSGFSFVGHA